MDAVTLALIKSMAGNGGGGSSLPAVTSADNGKVLAVDDGEWAAGFRTQVDPVNIQHIPVTFDGSSFTTTITPKDVEDGFTYDGQVQPSFSQSQLSVIDFYVGGEVLGCSNLTIYESNSDGPTFRTYISDLDGLGFANEFGYFALDSAGNDNPYLVSLVSWAKGGKYVVTLTPTALDYSGTMDKTVAEINAAYEAGQEIVFRVVQSANAYLDVACTAQYFDGSDYPSFNGFIVSEIGVLIYAYTATTGDGTKQTYSTKVYSLTPAS